MSETQSQATVIITREQLQEGWTELRGLSQIHHEYFVVCKEGDNYVVRNPKTLIPSRKW